MLDTFSSQGVTATLRRASKELYAESLVPSRSVLSQLVHENNVTLFVHLVSRWRILLSKGELSLKSLPPPLVTTSVILTARGAAPPLRPHGKGPVQGETRRESERLSITEDEQR